MSASATRVTDQHFDYIAEHTSGDDAFLQDLKAAAVAEDIPRIWVSPAQASLMQILLKLHGAKEVVEVGTLAGYSAIAMARALPEGGRVRTIEINEKHAEFTKQWVAKSDVPDKVEVHLGAGVDVLKTFEDDSADACFLDADKSNYPNYLDECLRIVRTGGLFMVDNAFAFGQLFDENPSDSDVPHVKAFNDYMAGNNRLHSIIVPVGDGCWVGVKTA
jgi:predicted O-methyltransferase YrrM